MNKRKIITKILNILFFMLCIWGIFISIRMNMENRSLWRDEASLAESFLTRSIFKLFDGKFLNNQSAPIGWLLTNKIIVLLLGKSEFVLRVLSILGYATTIFLIYLLSKKYINIDISWAGPAIYANLTFTLKYSNIFKPYICDGLFVLLVILVFYLYDDSKIKGWMMAFLCAILIWFSNPTCFIEGGLLVSCMICALYKKDKKLIIDYLITGLLVLVSFTIYYFCWLKEVATGNDMQTYWQGQNFPFFPTSIGDIHKAIAQLKEIFSSFGKCRYFIFLFLIFGMVISVHKKNKIIIGTYLGILITFFASYINMFPIEDRLWFFFIPLCIYISIYSVNEIMSYKDTNILYLFMCAILTLMVFVNSGLIIYSNMDNVYWNGEEINVEIEYLNENITSDDTIYVYVSSVPAFKYKNGYEMILQGDHYLASFGGYKNNVIYGRKQFSKQDDYESELDMLREYDKLYIVTTHTDEEKISGLMEALNSEGTLVLASDEYETYLWYYIKNCE